MSQVIRKMLIQFKFRMIIRTLKIHKLPVYNDMHSFQIFIGNFDITTIITNYFDHPIICSRIRLIPQTWTNWMSMRAEFRGCFQRYGKFGLIHIQKVTFNLMLVTTFKEVFSSRLWYTKMEDCFSCFTAHLL